MTQTFIEILTNRKNRKKIYFLKKVQKSLWDSKTDVTFAPRQTRNVSWKTDKNKEKKEKNIFRKNFSKRLSE